jgi:hypothetical protein
MLGHLQKLMKHGFMVAAELEACCVPEDPMFPAPAEGYMVSVVVFGDWACHCTSSTTHFYGIMAVSFTT